MTAPPQKQSTTLRLLSRAHTQEAAARIHIDKIANKPLLLTPTTKSDLERRTAQNVRSARRARRTAIQARKSRKPRPLSAKERREKGIYDIPAAEKKFEIYKGLHALWCGYMRDVLGVPKIEPDALDAEKERQRVRGELQRFHVGPANAGPKITGADFHGAYLTVVRCRCVGRVGTQGIVVRDTKFTFVIITDGNELKTIPKEHTIFRFAVPLEGTTLEKGDRTGLDGRQEMKDLVFELHGSQFENRAPDRATKKFKVRIPSDL